MAVLLTIYWLCFGVGLVYVLLAGVLGAVGHGMHAFGADGDQSGDFGHEGGMGDLHGDLSAQHGGAGDAGGGDLSGDLSVDLDSDSGGLGAEHGGLEHGGHAGHGLHLGHLGHGGPGAESAADQGFAEYNPLSPLSVMGFLCAFGAAGLIGTAYKVSIWASLGIAAGGGLAMAILLWLLIGKLLYSMQGSSEAHAADMLGLEAEVITPVEHEMSGEIAYILEGERYTAPARLLGEGRIEKHETVRIRRISGNTVMVERRHKLLE